MRVEWIYIKTFFPQCFRADRKAPNAELRHMKETSEFAEPPAQQQVCEAALPPHTHFLRQSDPETCRPLKILDSTASRPILTFDPCTCPGLLTANSQCVLLLEALGASLGMQTYTDVTSEGRWQKRFRAFE